MLFELEHDKTNKMTYVYSEDWDQPGHPQVWSVFGILCPVWSVFIVHFIGSYIVAL